MEVRLKYSSSFRINQFILIIGLIFCFLLSKGQTTLYSENFNSTTVGKGIDGVTTNTTGITTWSINSTGSWSPMAAGEYFKVVNVGAGNNVFESFNTDAPGTTEVNSCVWSTTLIAISGFSNVTISVDLSRNSSNSGSGCQAYYSIDGAADVSFGSCIGSASNTTAVVSGLCGSSLLVKVYHWGTSSTPQYRHDNVLVTGTAVLEPSSYPSTFSAAPNSNCTQLDLTFSAPSSITNAVGYLILQKQGSLPTGVPSDRQNYSVGNVIGDGTVAAIITNTSQTTINISGLTGSTSYYFKVFPYYYNGSSSCTYNYYSGGTIGNCSATTNSCVSVTTEPSANPASFTSTISPTCGRLILNFSAASTISNAYGYLILRKQGSAPTGLPSDANSYTIGSTIGDATVVANINTITTTTFSDNALSNATQYYYSIFPYNYDGSNPLSYNYRTTGFLTTNQTTIWCENLVGSPIGNQGGGYHTPGVGPHGGNDNWWAVNLYTKTDMHNGGSSNVHNIISSICLDLNRSDPNWSSAAVSQSMDFNIYMANYSNVSTFPSAYGTEAALNAGTGVTWTLVFSGSYTFSGLGWNTINLTTPFYYNGTGSLLVKYTRNCSSCSSSNYPSFGYLDASPTSDIRNRNQTQVNADYKYMKIAFNSTCTNNIVLPIELTRFEGDCNNGNVMLTWQTSSEKNNKAFTIERSFDGNTFQSIGSVKGNGNSVRTINYSFIDQDNYNGIAYYRISQEDYNTNISHSKIIFVDRMCNENEQHEINMYPNPSQNRVFIDLKLFKKSDISIGIYDQFGRIVSQITDTKIDTGLQNFNIDIDTLPSGIYYVKITINQKEETKKLIKL